MDQAPYKAIFFDLDGTLLPMEMDAFMQGYYQALDDYVASQGLDMATFKAGLHRGVVAMAEHEDEKSNAEVFWEAFFSEAAQDRAVWDRVLNYFYENTFNEIGNGVLANPCAARSISILQGKGYPLVLATMPMFPLRAVEWRLAWAGVDPRAFCRITHYENSTSVKPKLSYFAENLQACKLAPHEVLMVGNNTKDDLACLSLGMDAYLITDFLINRNEFDLGAVKHGSFTQFVSWVEGLLPCSCPATGIETGLVGR
ncbi:MAG: HAD family hydrolase [Eggerthellaceae bacterium]|nr:HAD family hydrolase [Eggerthellaceae bacterium]